MSSDLPHFESPCELGQAIVACIDRFLNQHPAGNNKNWIDLKARLLRWVKQVEPAFAFDGLLWILENHDRYQYQLVAGELLQLASLASSLSLDELFRRVLPTFEKSASSVPAYIRNVFGKVTVLRTLDELEKATADPRLIGKIQTMRYWMGAMQDSSEKSK
jgi:hypothetical protein